jgi:PTS system nitrogen regulatory IIA component
MPHRKDLPMARNKTPAAPLAEPLLTITDVAAYLQIGKRTVFHWAQKGQIPSFKLGNVWRFRQSELDAWITASRETTPRKPR